MHYITLVNYQHMRAEPPVPPPKAHVDPIIYVFMAMFSILLFFGLLFNWTPMWVVGVLGLFFAVFIYFSCPPRIHYSGA